MQTKGLVTLKDLEHLFNIALIWTLFTKSPGRKKYFLEAFVLKNTKHYSLPAEQIHIEEGIFS